MTIEQAQTAIAGGAKVILPNWPEVAFLKEVNKVLGVPNVAIPSQLPTFTLPGYRWIKPLGKGGAGEVWLVEELR